MIILDMPPIWVLGLKAATQVFLSLVMHNILADTIIILSSFSTFQLFKPNSEPESTKDIAH